MRGYGGTSSPEHFADYTCYTLAADMLGLLGHLGVAKAALVGHDHGAATGWTLSLLHPEVFTCYMALSVPFSGHSEKPPIENFRSVFGDEMKPDADPAFFYMLHVLLIHTHTQHLLLLPVNCAIASDAGRGG